MNPIPYTISTSSDYVIGVEKNQLVLVPTGASPQGGPVLSETAVLLMGTQSGPTGAITLPNTLTLNNNFTQGSGTFSSSGTGAKTLTATTANVTLGATTTGLTTLTRLDTLTAVSADTSGTPGNATNNNLSGRAAFAAAASTCVITNSKVTATSKVFVSLGGSDATLTSVRVTPGAGSFTVTGNAAATGATVFDWFVVN